MSMCDRCIHSEVCGLEDNHEEALKYCRDFLGWIPVSERLPEESDYCLCCDKDGFMTIGVISHWSKEWCFDDPEVNFDVVAWMPLPEPYYEPQESEDKKSQWQSKKDIINEAYSRANSIDAVRGLAYRSGHIRESEELDRARTMIFKLIDYIEDIVPEGDSGK